MKPRQILNHSAAVLGVAAVTSILLAASIDAKANGQVKPVGIGTTTALIAEAGLATGELTDGQSANVDFPFANFKAIATVGEVDAANGLALTGYPDGQAAYLIDEETVRVVYQSESYATMGRAPSPETYPWAMESGVTFTGSHIHTIDYDRASMAGFMKSEASAAGMVKDSGKLFDKVYNAFGELVTGRSHDPADLGAKWGNQTRADGTLIQFSEKFRLSEADYFFQSFCGAWYEPANKYGDGIGFADDTWLTAEEWSIGRMFPASQADANATLGLASIVVDIASETAYTVPALGQTGYEKMMPINPGHKDYVVLVMAGYNHSQEPAPNRIYVGMKNRMADGSAIDYNSASERDAFLGRNGLLYGKIYGLAVQNDVLSTLVETPDPSAKMLDAYLTNADAPSTFQGIFVPSSYQWGGWDETVAVQDTEMMLWEKAEEQPEGHTYFNGDSKTEHPASDPDIRNSRYVQNMTQEGGLLAFDLGDLGAALTSANGELPAMLDVQVKRTVAAVDGSLTLKTDGQFKTVDGDASIHMKEGVAKIVAPDGLYWFKSADGDYLILDEDSGNDFGERKYVLPINAEMDLVEPGSGYLLAIAGGKHSSRYQAGVSALGGAFTKAGTTEFSGSWSMTAMLSQKEDGSFYSMDELAGTGTQEIESSVPTAEQTFLGVVQARPESSGPVAENGGDAGGQIFMFNIDLPVTE
ncbi:MAG: hypothetical protein KTR32_19705 [Granulosicoccus sp.]|nr:hypothetical protein [Granulosicoccus sp.]